MLREIRTSGLSGGRRPALRRASSDATPVNPPNNASQPAAEAGKGRAMTKGNSVRLTKSQTQDWTDVSYKLDWVGKAAREDRSKRFTTLMHHLTPHLLLKSFGALRKDAASGVDEMTCARYPRRKSYTRIQNKGFTYDPR
jgi:hypothetical protein